MTTSFVTGSSTGIGYATALRLAREGHDVIATMRTPSSSDIADVAKSEGLTLEVKALDVTDTSAVDQVIKEVLSDRGGIDVLVNNAGINGSGVMEEADLALYDDVMQTNFFGAIRCTKAVLPSMRERGSGCIVNISSQGGQLAVPTLGVYSASKWALEAAMETLAVEVHRFGIRVALIEPGAIITPIMGKSPFPSMDTPYARMYRRFGILAIHDFSQGSAAEVVADCVLEAITTDSPRLRWPVGQGAERNLRVRAEMSDEEFIETWNLPDDDDFKARMLPDAE
jgi:NAD(P)-dependent dehydrogenase (short-subunit alcohol dehydrogenase family)